jgi:predicted short-subunit dehydrogenase-like oxidoreductase (DUF2520 family)
MNQSNEFVSIGAGNVASHLVKALCDKGYKLMQVYSRTASSAESLAKPYKAEITTSTENIFDHAGFYLVSVPDQILPSVLEKINIRNKLIFHTAGSMGLEVFGADFRHFGVMYPLQTFTKNSVLKISDIPFFIEAGDNESLIEIRSIANALSDNVIAADSETRRWIHLAAVFACNFTNQMLVLSDEILQSRNLDITILKPLIEETIRKSLIMNPKDAQTGPAVRNDTVTMERHLNMLRNQQDLQKIYTFISESIIKVKLSNKKKSGQ